jgi:hypothetical protein
VLDVLHMFTNLSDLSKALEVSDHAEYFCNCRLGKLWMDQVTV